jgi:hypothetical protein
MALHMLAQRKIRYIESLNPLAHSLRNVIGWVSCRCDSTRPGLFASAMLAPPTMGRRPMEHDVATVEKPVCVVHRTIRHRTCTRQHAL